MFVDMRFVKRSVTRSVNLKYKQTRKEDNKKLSRNVKKYYDNYEI